MRSCAFRSSSVAILGHVVLLFLQSPCSMAQSSGASSPGPQEEFQERKRLTRQVDELRQAGKLDEAVAAALRALQWERQPGGELTPGVADALSRLAELHELSGQWDRALERRKEALTIRERLAGKDHWSSADALLALAFVERVTRLEASGRTKVQTAPRERRRGGAPAGKR